MDCRSVSYSRHALERMFARRIEPAAVRAVLSGGDEIEAYADDRPFPSYLLVGRPGGRWLHVVVARDSATGRCIVVTAYLPDPSVWEEGCKRRRPS